MHTFFNTIIVVTLLLFLPGLLSAQDTICIYFDTLNIEQVSVDPPIYRIPMYGSNVLDVSGINTELRIAGAGDPTIVDISFDESIESSLNAPVISEDSLEVNHAFLSLAPTFSWPNNNPLGFLTVRADLINNPISITFSNLTAVTVLSNPPLIPIKGIDVLQMRYDPLREIVGMVKLPSEDPVAGIILSLQTPDTLLLATTAPDGSYNFSVPAGPGVFQLAVVGPESPYSRAQRITGINVADIDLIYRHAAETLPITSVFSLIAADVNEDGNVDAVDAELIRAYTFLRIDAFTGSPYFRFLTGEEAPRETVDFENGIPIDQEIDFVLLKKGDVNFSAE